MRIFYALAAGTALALTGTAALAQQNLTGTVIQLDEQKGSITIQQQQGGTIGGGNAAQEFKAKDGLLFNALKPGDKITFTVADEDGTKTITKLDKQ
jgi:Cu/Ag efflux protein CusF